MLPVHVSEMVKKNEIYNYNFLRRGGGGGGKMPDKVCTLNEVRCLSFTIQRVCDNICPSAGVGVYKKEHQMCRIKRLCFHN